MPPRRARCTSTFSQSVVDARVAQFRDQTRRYLAGELDEDAFKPLRLQNGLYIQRHAPMLRIAIPYGVLSATQLRGLARITEDFDEGWGHFSTRQNLQLNGPTLESVPDILEQLAGLQMHAVQTSGNCIRNVTTDHFAGVAVDEIADPRPYAELIRQWSTLHPEFAFLPRKFKIALTGSPGDRAAIHVHYIGLAMVAMPDGAIGFDVWVGGGLGRTPILASPMIESLPQAELLNYLEAVLRVYNRHGRRDNLYKARIKILVRALGADRFRSEVDAEWQALRADEARGRPSGPGRVSEAAVAALVSHFDPPDYPVFDDVAIAAAEARIATEGKVLGGFARWLARSRQAHRQPGFTAITISLKDGVHAPGDCTAAQMRAVADAADAFGFGEIRVSHHQNLVLPDVRIDALPELYSRLRRAGLAAANIGLLSDIIACPGGDFCSLANARSIPIALAIQETFEDLDALFDIGELELNISGCMNSCGHHHVGHIGILGVDKQGESFYQLSIGGLQGPTARLGRILGPSFAAEDIPDAIERLVRTYLGLRESRTERFVDAVQRLGIDVFKEAVYAYAD
ncbi:MAG: nitrite/sulfite reductase [Burkholderiaceae bacterium]